MGRRPQPAGRKAVTVKEPEPLRRFGPVLVFALAFGLRLVYLLQARANDPLFYAPQLDGLYHHQWALAVSRGLEFINDAYFRAPLYPLFLGMLYRLFGVNLFLVRLVQALLGSAGCVLVMLLGRRVFDLRTGFYAGLMMAVYPLLIFFDGELLIPVLLIFLLLAGFVLLYQEERGWFYLPLAGLCFGLGAIARPNVLVFVLALFFWLLLRPHRRRLSRALLFGLAVLVPILPVTVRNYIKSRSFVLIAWQAGTNFYIGNNEYSDGTTAIVPGTRGSWWGGYNDVKRIAEQTAGRPLRGVEIDRFWISKGLEFWRRSPARALLLTLRKLYLWFAGYEVSNNRDIYFFKRFTFLNWLIFQTPVFKFPFGFVLPLALAGIYLTRKKWRVLVPVYLFLGAWCLSFIPFFVTERYRLPTVPFYLLLAVAGVRSFFQRERRERTFAGLIFAGALILFNLNLAGAGRKADMAQNLFQAANGWYETGRLERAQTALEQALALDSATNILSLQATILLAQNRIEEAEKIAQAAVRLHPQEADAWGIAGNVHAAAGQLDSARLMFERVIELDPYGPEGWNNLGNLHLSTGELERARFCYEQALRNSPNFVLALFHLGLVDYYQGRKDSAHLRWLRVLELDPEFEKARRALQELR
ncbi:MAG: tetratricopeptide repeat protein [candidate division WOR-3 bacterium]|uniref:Tetratricopeptide repeat protein n=2 Tax=candidate division WOR-3 bacterium TaxID=2052148 RepID=A0A7C3IWL0_UNCW3|nr:tetratricopeptide repeat protein [candidate division WOR-3 bacterium]